MKRPDGILVMAAVVVAVLLAGEFISYGPGTYVSESEVILDEDGYNIVLDTNYSTEYTVLVTETDANGEPRHLYIYRDFDYASFIEDSYLDYWIEKMAAEFEAYNFTDFTIIDAEGIRDMMAGSVYNGTASQTAVLFLTGILPDTVYGEDEDNLFQAWLSAGGFVYWSGAPIGMFVGHERTADTLFELVTDDPGDRFFGIPGSIRTQEANDMAQDHSSDRYIGEALNIYYDSCNYGVSSDVPDSLFIGYEKDGYNSIALSRYVDGTGQLCIFGGAFPPSDMQTAHSNILKVFFSGLCYDSVVTMLENSEKGSGEMTISLGIGPTDEAVVFVMYGSLLGTYGNTYYIPGAEPLRRYT